jgi:hypothetical protein
MYLVLIERGMAAALQLLLPLLLLPSLLLTLLLLLLLLPGGVG